LPFAFLAFFAFFAIIDLPIVRLPLVARRLKSLAAPSRPTLPSQSTVRPRGQTAPAGLLRASGTGPPVAQSISSIG
jgi:hypothetical protein